MKKFISIIVIFFSLVMGSCSESGSTETRAGIIAEDFVKQDVISGEDLEFNLIGTDKESEDSYHVVAEIKTLNGLGVKVPRKVSVRLKYNGEGEWEDVNNWTLISINYLDEATGDVQSATPTGEDVENDDWDAFNDAQDDETETIAGVPFNVMFKNLYTENIASKNKLSKAKVKEVAKIKQDKDIYFYVIGHTQDLSDCYAYSLGGTITYNGETI